MGQRFIPDSYAFQQLVWGYVGEETNKREFPMGLDVMTVLGSDQAYKIEKQDFGQDQYVNWESQIKKVNGEFAARDCGRMAGQSLYRLARVTAARDGLPGGGRPGLHEVSGMGAQEPEHGPGQLDRTAPRHHPLCQAVGNG